MPFADPPTAGEQARLERLAADPSFDPDDYQGLMVLEMGRGIRCRVCRTLHAPGGLCGYCRGRVKAIRNTTGRSSL